MAYETEIFSSSGPVHLTAVDWNYFDHRKSISASLVQGVYIQERDRQENRHWPQALAPSWWKFFNFELTSALVDKADSSIFGAIYEFKPQPYNHNYPAPNYGFIPQANNYNYPAPAPAPAPNYGFIPQANNYNYPAPAPNYGFIPQAYNYNHPAPAPAPAPNYGFIPQANNYNYPTGAPKYVVAFRGTLLKPDSILQDAKSNFKLLCESLHKGSRFEIAMREIQKLIDFAGAENIWLAGHSLGSAIAMLVGKNMAKMNCRIETYLFNPPYISVPIELIENPEWKHRIRVLGSCIKAGIASIKGHHQRPEDDQFDVLSKWIPYLFVNPEDHFCREYIGYFKHRKNMEEIGAGKIGKIATQHSLRNQFFDAIGNDSEPMHLLPSAFLTINLCRAPNFKGNHGIEQWWRTDYRNCQSELHQFRK